MTYRQQLDHQMRLVLAQLELISTIPASNPNSNVPGSDESPGGRRPPGDYGYRSYAEWYGSPFAKTPGCRGDQEREQCIKAARAELEHLRHGTRRSDESLEAPKDTRRKLLDETEGWSLQAVATSHWRTSPSMMRKLRVADGRDAETGYPVELSTDTGLDLASRARELKQSGMSVRQITMALGLKHSNQVQRLLKRAA